MVELILDKGLVIDAFVRVSLVGIELITIDARIVVASVDTCLRFAEATNRLDTYETRGQAPAEFVEEWPESLAREGAEGKAKGALDAAKGAIDAAKEAIEETLETQEEEVREARRAKPPRWEREP